MAIDYKWNVSVYDKAGTELAILNGSGVPAGSGLHDMQLSFPLNGIDTFSFTIYLDDPQIDPDKGGNPGLITAPERVIKVWRYIYDDTDPLNIIQYLDPPGTPAFCGNVTRIEKNGQLGQMYVLCQCPYWRLQSRFHLLNHYLVIDYPGQNSDGIHEGGNMDGAVWDVSALCFRLIDLINHAFGNDSYTGIVKPLSGPPFWPKTLTMIGGYRAAKGNNVWVEVSELLWATNVSVLPPDLFPQYVHYTNSWELMEFQTKVKRGDDISGSVSYDFCIGLNNLDDFQEVFEVTPENFANFVWAVGQAGPNVAKRTAKDQTGPYGYDNIGIYMYYSDKASHVVKASNPIIQWYADAELKRLVAPPKVYSAFPAPLVKPYYYSYPQGKVSGNATSFWTLGDVAQFRADKGALQVNRKQRIYEAVLTMSENCVESYQIRIAKDFFGKVAVT